MSLFITGAGGFVGRNFIEYLLELDPVPEMCCLVRQPQKALFLQELRQKHPQISIIQGDLLVPATYRDALESCEKVFHIAAFAKLRDGDDFYPANTETTRALIKACQSKHGPETLKRFVFVSSIAAVDRPWDSPDWETSLRSGLLTETSPKEPHYDYGKSKLEAEKLLVNSGLPYTILRPAFIYGKYTRPGSSMDRVFRDVAANKAYTRFPFPGRISEIDAWDLAHALWLVSDHPAAENEDFFIANPEPVAVGELFRHIAEASGSHAWGKSRRLWPVPEEVLSLLKTLAYTFYPDESKYRLVFDDYFACDPGKLFETTGYRPLLGFEGGIRRTVSWYDAYTN